MNKSIQSNHAQFYKLIEHYLTSFFDTLQNHLEKHPELIKTTMGCFTKTENIIFYLGKTHLAVEFTGPEHSSKLDTEDFNVEFRDVTNSQNKLLEDILGFKFDTTSSFPAPLLPYSQGLFIPTNAGLDLLTELGWNISEHSGIIAINAGCPEPQFNKVTNLANSFFFNADSTGLVTRHINWLTFFPIINSHEDDDSLMLNIRFKWIEDFSDITNSYEPQTPSNAIHKKLNMLNRFIELWGNNQNSEPKITSFLSQKEHQFILGTRFGVSQIYSELICKWQSEDRPDIKPDFFIVHPDGYADILEFKLPEIGKKSVVGIKNREGFASWLQQYISQTRTYSNFFDDPNNCKWFEKTYGFKVKKPMRYLIVGRRHDFEADKLKEIEADYSRLKIITYDDLVDGAMAQLYMVRN